MAQKTARKTDRREKAPRRVLHDILLLLPPAALLAVYYIIRDDKTAASWAETSVAAPFRALMASFTSVWPLKLFSLAEALITALIVWTLVYAVRTVVLMAKRSGKLRLLLRRLAVLLSVGLWCFSVFSWSWDIGYRSESLSDKTGISDTGVSSEALRQVTALFAEKVNALAPAVMRDSGGHFSENVGTIFSLSPDVYDTISKYLPALAGSSHPPKSMFYSKLMSATGFTGFYFGPTGETNINTDAPACLIPATVAHEMAHQRGVHSEDEANFSAVASCVTSGIPVYEYSGYLDGLIYLSNALNETSPDACAKIMSSLNADVARDLDDNNAYWARFQSPATTAVTAMYDGFLKGNGQSLGVRSYGACVDMLVAWCMSGGSPVK